jgi:Kef-type K+ transport system membrane component KefB
MGITEFLRAVLLSLPPLAKFAVGMSIIVVVPPLCRRIKLPAVAGLLMSGVLIGPHVLDIITANHPVADFMADLGKLLLMFFAGLEIDMTLFKQVQNRSLVFGLLTCAIPQILGSAVALGFGYGLNSAIVIGSLLGSHTLLAFPIIDKLGETRLEPITVTIGATIVSTILSLIVFAICVPIQETGFSLSRLAIQLVEIAAIIPLILVGLSRVGGYALRQVENDEDVYFVLVFALIAVAALLAEGINLPGIVGAFLVGLAVNTAVRDKPAKAKLEFFGNSFFIPIFFVVTGFLIDPRVFVQSVGHNFLLVSGIIAALVAGKWLAAEIAGRAFAYSAIARQTMWSLSLPQVAATLAAAIVAFNTVSPAGTRLIDRPMLDTVLVLMVTTSILGPVLTQYFAPGLLEAQAAQIAAPLSQNPDPVGQTTKFE